MTDSPRSPAASNRTGCLTSERKSVSMSNMTETQTSPATRPGTFDSTPIDRLATHKIVDGHAACDQRLVAMFLGNSGPVTCRKCGRL